MKPELLAPAGSPEALTAALRCGADAVYLGADLFSARQSASNFDRPALQAAAELCHRRGVKLYLAANTLIRDEEFEAFDGLIKFAANCGIHAVIVQDLGAAQRIRSMVPDLPIHASTQMSLHTPGGIAFARDLGISRVVAARELTESAIAALCSTGMEIEVFVHGALCMSVSGQCLLSAMIGGRSANRGRCAQPCRLPCSASSDLGYCGLSLRDLSLVKLIPKMEQLGVASLKIEGRMKRPEYVAAAVTSCRAVLDGKEPDYELLRAVFSRSGFTDAYFTGSRKNLFGIRKKEDVTAADQALPRLREQYRKENPCCPVTLTLTAQKNHPLHCSITDETGCTASVTGSVPEAARTHPADAEIIRQQLSKLGGTIYVARNIHVHLEAGLSLPASVINQLRRDAIAALDARRIQKHCPRYTIHATSPAPAQELAEKQPIWRAEIRTEAQLRALDLSALDGVCIPLELASQVNDIPKEKLILKAPRWIENEEVLINVLQTLFRKGYRRLLCQNPAHIAIGKALQFRLHGGFGMQLFNSRTAEVLQNAELSDCCVSPELSRSQITALNSSLPLAAVVYGHLPLMLTRCCPIQAQIGCRGDACLHRMKDRTGRTIPVLCDRTYTELFNAEPIWTADQPQLSRLSVFYLSFSVEPPEQVSKIQAAYLTGGGFRPRQFTRGRLERGVF